jgi:hypothetical protein
LAARHGQAITWLADATGSDALEEQPPFDLMLAIQVLPYVAELDATLDTLKAALAPGGELVISLDHPLRDCFYDVENDEFSPFPLRDYGEEGWLTWRFAPDVPMQMRHAPLGRWVDWLAEAGLMLKRLIEAPAPPALCDALWPDDSPLAPLRALPHTAILVCGARSA